jgi:hypothetical protein
MASADHSSSKGFFQRHTHWWVVAIVVPLILVLVGVGIWRSLNDYNSALHEQAQGECEGKNSNNSVTAVATVIAVDTDALTATMRLDFGPSGNLVMDNTLLTLRHPMTMTTTGLLSTPTGSTSTGVPAPGGPSYQSASSSYVYLAGDYMQDQDVVVPLTPGTLGNPSPAGTSSARYPWDTYTDASTFSFQFHEGIGTDGAIIPSCVGVTSSVGGWKVTESPANQDNGFDISFARSSPVKFYCYFVMLLMWALALGGVAMAVIMMMRKQDEIDTAAFAYLAALLFAFPLIRQTLPGNPGPGSLIDILAYYWTEVIVATTLVVLLARWITLKGKQDRVERQDDSAEVGASGSPAAGPGPIEPPA